MKTAIQSKPRAGGPHAGYTQAVDKEVLALHAATDSRSFIRGAHRLLHVAVPHDVTYVMLHYFSGFGRLTETWASDGSKHSEEWLRGHHAANPAHRALAADPGRKVLSLRECYDSEAEMLDSKFYREYMVPIKTRHAIALFVWNQTQDGVDCGIGIHRGPGQPDFTPAEMATVAKLHSHIETAFRRVAKLQSDACAREGLQSFLRTLPLPTILLDWSLVPIYHNAAAAEAIAQWDGARRELKRARSILRLPPDLIAVMKRMRDDWTRAVRTEPGSTAFEVHELVHPQIAGLRAIITMTPLRSPQIGNPSFLLRFTTTVGAGIDPLTSLSHLSRREREIALLVCEGKSNQEIADSIGRSLATVKTELHSVFKKLEVSSRARLMALLR